MTSQVTDTPGALSARRRALLAALLRDEGAAGEPALGIPRREASGPAPLSFAQQRLWFFDQLVPHSPLYNLRAALRVSGPLHVPALQQSLAEIVRRHEALRTTVQAVEGAPTQVIMPPAPVQFQQVDLRSLPRQDREAE